MCGIGARFLFPSSSSDEGYNQSASSSSSSEHHISRCNDHQNMPLEKLHFLLQYGKLQDNENSDRTTNELVDSINEEQHQDLNNDDADDGRNESINEKMEKIRSIGFQSLCCKISEPSTREPIMVDASSTTTTNTTLELQSLVESISKAISSRGPDATNDKTLSFRNDSQEQIQVTLIASLLALRGDRPFPQPVSMNHGNDTHWLIWNGEIFGNEYFRECVIEHGNDTICLLNHLVNCSNETEVLNTFANIEGPFGFVYVNTTDNYLLFGRDILGRRSLLYCVNESGNELVLSSVACHIPGFSQWRSIGVNGIFKLSLKPNQSLQDSLELIEWNDVYTRTLKKPLISDRHLIKPPTSSEQESLLVIDSDTYEHVVDEFIEHLSKAVQKRVTNIYDNTLEHDETTPKVCVLFSGGIDSVILTALTHLNLLDNEKMSIDLLNVSFGTNHQQQSQSADRKQAIEAWEELSKLYPSRNFRLVLIDVDSTELDLHRKTIEKLIYPQNTVIDFNIGSALWFASRGHGYIYNPLSSRDSKVSYTSPARVILCGIGSDEQLGGYKRHFKKFKREGWIGLNNEMDMDVKRLWIRNLGRDDRVISDHGRESRNPFLDEPFINFVREQPLWYLADFTTNNVEVSSELLPGDKKLLRRAAQKLGLKRSCMYVKRAMQFGSNVAKISYRKQHADTKIDIDY
ncbi:hypothetical protein C9374_009790 [Naegleria lovaniensis]|uniref:Glutamine amidotransferase type-2 domain-containing protein n=1 Tax=Naegleria lovaniensis TaxID=51637 RepID=A0AA88GY64_NAELO|nr:uncharacterized protein C9374_009790 [Naegleria lovaniensis]KAG2393213.1 hypothetical protein C9374_009790 [Naegleria lovaniensis]